MFFLLFSLIALFSTCSCMERVPFYSCNGGDSVSAIVMDPCNLAEISSSRSACILLHGTMVKVNAVFLAPFSSSNMEVIASANVNNNKIPFPDSGANPCRGHITPGCPIQKNNLYIFSYSFNILKFYPTGVMEIRFAIQDKKTKDLLGCAIIPVVVKRNPAIRYN